MTAPRPSSRALTGARARALARLAVAVVAGALVLGVTAAGAVAQLGGRADVRPSYEADGILVVLAIGSDIGMPYRSGDPLRGRADGLHVIAVDPASRRATIVDIPRDSLIGGRKVNGHLAVGGPERLVGQIEAYTGLDIDYWALTTFRGIEEMTRVLGGVEIDIERRMVDRFSGSNFAPGRQRLEGAEALAFVRNRKSLPDGDFGRTRNQGRFMVATHRELVAAGLDLRDVASHAALFARTTVSDIPPADLLPLALLALRIDPADVHHVPLSGGVGTSGGASVVHLRPGDTFERIRAGQVGPPG